MGKDYDERIARRRAEMAAGDKRQRLLLLGAVVVFAIIGLVLFAGSRMAKGPMDVNKASASQLEKLPGSDRKRRRRSSPDDLTARRTTY
ncbi:MAG: hypothetical protein R3F31_20760 [Verrucomicrobiales bacterium]